MDIRFKSMDHFCGSDAVTNFVSTQDAGFRLLRATAPLKIDENVTQALLMSAQVFKYGHSKLKHFFFLNLNTHRLCLTSSLCKMQIILSLELVLVTPLGTSEYLTLKKMAFPRNAVSLNHFRTHIGIFSLILPIPPLKTAQA